MKGWVKSIQQEGKPPKDYKNYIEKLGKEQGKKQEVKTEIELSYQIITHEDTPKKRENQQPNVITRAQANHAKQSQVNNDNRKKEEDQP